MTNPARQDYWPQLDALRFFAVFAVMVTHNWHPRRLPWLLGDLDWAGLGVRLFFVLSGFLITGILVNCRNLSDTESQPKIFFVRQFYARRFLRIFPIYYLTLAVALATNVPGARDVWGWLATYTTNIYITVNNVWIGRMGHLWSLAVEEHFYLFWPWLVLFAPRKWLIPAMLTGILVGPVYRLFAYLNFPFDVGAMDFKAGTFTFGSLDSLGVGALLALVWNSGIQNATLQRYLTRLILPVGVTLYLVSLLFYHDRVEPALFFVVGDLAAALVFAWLVSSAAVGFTGLVGRVLEFRPFSYLGKISYGIYVYHNLTPLALVPLLALFGIQLQVPSMTNFLLSTLLTIAIAALSWHLLELPINNLKRHFSYAPKSVVGPPEPVQP